MVKRPALAQSRSNAQIDTELFRSRLKEVAGGPLNAWLIKIGVRDTVYSALSRESVPGAETLAKIAHASGRSIDWLLGLRDDDSIKGIVGHLRGVNEPPTAPYINEDEFVYVKRYNVRASGGNGEFICEENAVGRYAYERDWWHRTMPCEPADCAIIYCDGRSMEPDILDGDPIMLTTADRGLRTDAVYVFRLGERLLVKRLQFLPGGKINVISSNKEDYPPYQIDQETLESPERGAVIGRVFGVPGGFRWIK